MRPKCVLPSSRTAQQTPDYQENPRWERHTRRTATAILYAMTEARLLELVRFLRDAQSRNLLQPRTPDWCFFHHDCKTHTATRRKLTTLVYWGVLYPEIVCACECISPGENMPTLGSFLIEVADRHDSGKPLKRWHRYCIDRLVKAPVSVADMRHKEGASQRFDYAKIRRLRVLGLSYAKIAAKIGCCRQTVANALRGWSIY